MSKNSLSLGKTVRIKANGSQYEGKLIGIDENEIYLRSTTRTWAIALNEIQSVSELNVNEDRPALEKSLWAEDFLD